LYNTRCGNFIVISPENVAAKWDHEIGWANEEEDPFCSLGWSMSDLVENFVSYLSLGGDLAEEAPFYY
jgi:hypothetical protein